MPTHQHQFTIKQTVNMKCLLFTSFLRFTFTLCIIRIIELNNTSVIIKEKLFIHGLQHYGEKQTKKINQVNSQRVAEREVACLKSSEIAGIHRGVL